MGTPARMMLNAIRMLYPEARPTPLRILDFGSQFMSGRSGDYAELIRHLGRGRSVAAERDLTEKCEAWEIQGRTPARNPPLSAEIFALCDVIYHSVDLSPDATIRADLNSAQVPSELRGSFDVVANFGTTEHVFNQMNCFRYVHDATRVGGGMIHMLPMTGYMLHCLFKYDAKFFPLLAQANEYEVVYAGFGDLEAGRRLDERFRNWIKYEEVKDLAHESRLAEVVLRKTREQHFQPAIDLSADSTPFPHDFAAAAFSLREGMSMQRREESGKELPPALAPAPTRYHDLSGREALRIAVDRLARRFGVSRQNRA